MAGVPYTFGSATTSIPLSQLDSNFTTPVTIGTTTVALGNTTTTLAGLTSVATNTLTSAAATALTLQSAGSTAITVDTSQNVGVGTTSPSYKVEMAITSGSNFYSATTSAAGQDIGYRLASTATGGREYRITTSDPTRGGNTNSLAFVDQTAGAARMLIDSSGNLLVGTTSTSVTSGGYNFLINDGGTGYSTGYIGHITGTPSGYAYLNFKYAGTTVGTITQNGTTGVLYNLTSDYRLKNNQQPLTGAKEFVMALQPKKWQWWDGSGEGVGFIAHEFMEVAKYSGNGTKDAVDADGKPVMQSIQPSSSEVMANLVSFIQEQQALITALTARITALESK